MKKFLMLISILLLSASCASTINQQTNNQTQEPAIVYDDNYCKQFTNEECPSQCEVRSSCPICEDLAGCKSKVSKEEWKKRGY